MVNLRELQKGSRQAAAGTPSVGAEGSLSPATGPGPFETEELPATFAELLERRYARERAREAELIARRRATGDPDPWGGKAPRQRIYELEQKRCLPERKGDLTPAEADESQQIARLYPEDVDKLRKMVERRLYGEK